MCNYVLYMYKYAINIMEVPEIIERGNLIIERKKLNYRTGKFNYRTDPNPRGIGIRRSTKVRYFTVFLYSWLRSIILAPPVYLWEIIILKNLLNN